MNPDSHDLIQRHMAAQLSEEEAALLQTRLKADADLRRLYLHYMNLDVALEAQAGSRDRVVDLLRVAPMSETKSAVSRWLAWRPLSAAAAGLMTGLFSASLVFGYVAQNRGKSVMVLSEGFEHEDMPLDRDLPRRADVWSGNFTRPHAGDERVSPPEGSRMVTLPPVEARKFSYAMRFMDLRTLAPSEPAQGRQIEVTASFHGHEASVADRFQIRLAAFGGSLEEARAIWLSPQINEQALLHVARTVTAPAGEGGWKTLRATIDLPPGATLLLVSLAAAVADSDAPKTPHYLDDVRIQLHTANVAP